MAELGNLVAGRPVVVFIGGGNDSKNGHMRKVEAYYRSRYRHHSTAYVFHTQAALVKTILHKVPNVPVALVGHSWGGNTALDVGYKFRQRTIDLIVTLDAVGKLTSWRCQPPHVRWWTNVYVDNTLRHRSNLIADLGGHYGHRPGANRNVNLGRGAVHSMALQMFQAVEREVVEFDAAGLHPGGRLQCHQ